MKGRYYWNQRTADSLRIAIGHYETALRLDPTYAPAYAALADCYNLLGTVMVSGGSPRTWRPRAAEAAIKALQIDPDLAEAHATLGYVRHYNWEWEESGAIISPRHHAQPEQSARPNLVRELPVLAASFRRGDSRSG